ncbi:MAG: ribosome biogenesis GTP-binding protein YihA/YsxC [Saprospiraceae bacterium]|jgi:GTP-binding protein|nr:ribosome biogenesis GTP-binding protein YihA/YsxC [Saprospiraceae bacterium]MDP4999059.1 ribosome biogenesis GTP-binding protein YihA/YsxC [Saprospiraceae bacterium]
MGAKYQIIHANYIGSYPSEEKCPGIQQPEYAFIGRSNVGKSSLINMLCQRQSLALTSRQPGKTQMINYFHINNNWYLVDLPGYGYAKISKAKRQQWKTMIENYLAKRWNLQVAFALIDANIPPQKIDIDFINRLGEMRVPYVLVYTKTDKSKPDEINANIAAFREKLLEYWETLPREFITSANQSTGREAILDFILEVNARFDEEGI